MHNSPPFFHSYNTEESCRVHARGSTFAARKDVPYTQLNLLNLLGSVEKNQNYVKKIQGHQIFSVIPARKNHFNWSLKIVFCEDFL